MIRKNQGFSLIEVMVVVCIMGIIAAGISTLSRDTFRTVMSVSATSDFNSLVNSIQGVLNNNQNCIAAFGGAGATTLSGTYPQAVQMTVGGTTITVGSFGNSLKIKNFDFTGQTPAGAVNQWVVPLNLVADRIAGPGVAVGGSTVSHIFNLVITLDAANKIQNCSGQNTDYWVAASNGPTNIDYMGGNVGIGTTSPVVNLDVVGGVRPGSSAAVTVCGMGVANGEGTQRYNYATHTMEYCNGTTWTSIGAFQTVSNTCPAGTNPLGGPGTFCSVACPAGTNVYAGGCLVNNGSSDLQDSAPVDPSGNPFNGWLCFYSSSGFTSVKVWASCQ